MSEVCKKLYPQENTAALIKFFGDPRGRDGKVSSKWFSENMVEWKPPYLMYFGNKNSGIVLKRFFVHKKCLKSFDGAFKETLKTFGEEGVDKFRLNLSGGVFNYRLERGGRDLSTHSWGIAIDMDPNNNPFPKKWNAKKGINQEYVAIMEKHGFWWRGENGDIDPMHFQCAWR